MTDSVPLVEAQKWLIGNPVWKSFLKELANRINLTSDISETNKMAVTVPYVVMGRRIDSDGTPLIIPCMTVYFSPGVGPYYVGPLTDDTKQLTKATWLFTTRTNAEKVQIKSAYLEPSTIVLLEGAELENFRQTRHTVANYKTNPISPHTDELLLLTRDEFIELLKQITT